MSVPAPIVKKFSPEVYQCRRATQKHVLDGDLDKSFWNDAEWTIDFNDIEGDCKPKPRFRTRAKMLWDDNAIYFGAELMGDEIWGYVTERDDVIFRDNDFEIFIDPDSDSQEYCEFEMNALNTVWDLLLTKAYRDGGHPMNGFDLKGLRTATKIDGKLNDPSAKSAKWTCEIVMPFETILECRGKDMPMPKNGDYWRVNFSRVQWKVDVKDNKFVKRTDEKGNVLPEDNWVWSPMGIVNMHCPELWAFVFFCGGNEEYTIPEDEFLKWQLRLMYYAQHEYYDKNGKFNAELKSDTAGFEAKVQVTDNNFEISCLSADKKCRLIIFADGKTIKH